MLGFERGRPCARGVRKRDYGTWVHGLLNRLHRDMPVLSEHRREADAGALSRTRRRGVRRAGGLLDSLGWKTHPRLWPIPASTGSAREAEGWRWQSGEVECATSIALAAGGEVRLVGRLDRIDLRGDDTAILDYKTQRRERLERKVAELGEDVQLALRVAASRGRGVRSALSPRWRKACRGRRRTPGSCARSRACGSPPRSAPLPLDRACRQRAGIGVRDAKCAACAGATTGEPGGGDA